jgi:tape measure domain-containing protein
MAEATTRVKIEAIVSGLESVEALKGAVRRLQGSVQPASADLTALRTAVTQLGSASIQTERSLQTQISVLRDVRSNVALAGKEYKDLTIQINQAERALAKANSSGGSTGGGLRRFGQTAGAIAASGVFGGPEGLIGAGIGAFAGPGGALAGGAIGAQVGMLRQSIGASAEYAAQIGRLQIALQGVTRTSDEYASAQEVIFRISKDLNVPVLEATKGFTQLSASVIGAGGKVNDAAVVFRSFTQAIKATGGGAEEVNGVMTALTQIFSKGKISAEEINQIAERLPGAFTAIATATGRTGSELQDALKKGEIGLNDLMKTADYLTTQYSASAERMAKSTDDAGARMKVALDQLGKTFGDFFKPIGAGFQDFITQIVTATNKMFEMAQMRAALGKTVSLGEQIENNKTATRIAELRYPNNPEKQRIEINKLNQELQANSLKKMAIEAGIIKTPIAAAATQRTVFNPPKSDTSTEKSNKAAENAAQRLREKIKQQLADADKLFSLETARLDITLAATKQEELEAKYSKVIVERREKYLSLQKNAVSEQERMRIAEAQSVAITADHQTYLGEINKLMQDQTKELYAQVGLSATLSKNLQAAFAGAFTGGTATGTFRTDIDLMPGLTGGKLGGKMEELKKILTDLQDPINQIIVGAEQIGTAFSESFTGLINGSMTAQESLGNFFRNIGNYFLDMASKMIAKYIEMQIIGLAQKFLPGMFGGIFGPSGPTNYSGAFASPLGFGNQYSYSANGNVFAQNGIVPYAKGGIVDRPMMFPFAKGIGLMGEAGPEAIMPLKRGADGKLGVAGGGGGTVVNVSVDASGSSVQGNNGQSAALGRAIAASVQAELVKQKRPGGLLA